MQPKIKLLFVCSKNQWRSPTAEHVWRKDARVLTRSAGTSAGARRQLTAADLDWCDIVFVMEEKHKKFISAHFSREIEQKTLHVLDIPDEYRAMDPDLISELTQSVAAILQFD